MGKSAAILLALLAWAVFGSWAEARGRRRRRIRRRSAPASRPTSPPATAPTCGSTPSASGPSPTTTTSTTRTSSPTAGRPPCSGRSTRRRRRWRTSRSSLRAPVGEVWERGHGRRAPRPPLVHRSRRRYWPCLEKLMQKQRMVLSRMNDVNASEHQGAGSSRLRRSRPAAFSPWRGPPGSDRADLLEQGEVVHERPMFGEPPIRHAEIVHHRDVDPAAGGGIPWNSPVWRPGSAAAPAPGRPPRSPRRWGSRSPTFPRAGVRRACAGPPAPAPRRRGRGRGARSPGRCSGPTTLRPGPGTHRNRRGPGPSIRPSSSAVLRGGEGPPQRPEGSWIGQPLKRWRNSAECR